MVNCISALPFSCAVLFYMLDIELILQPKSILHKEHGMLL
jgi:hypothetical protein